ncbi:MAG: AraC family transcriptional regulator [Lachnospiraceae bacterium]|nr:AraC family transcriptional regulator [Lachnospiraceae bacterium]
MKINNMGWHWKHAADFCKERPRGINGFQVIVLQSKARVGMGDKIYNVDKNTAFVIDSCFPHYLYGDGEEYVDDWFRYDLEEEDKCFFDELEIEKNVPIKLESDVASEMIALCEKVYVSESADKEETLRYLLRAFFMQIKEGQSKEEKPLKVQYEKEIGMIRKQIYNDPSAEWSIQEIAKKLNLSVSHFQRLYKRIYSIPCTKDITTVRMEHAKQLLSTTELSVNDIAEKCGYSDYSQFFKVFRKYTCEQPSKYRKSNH